MRIIITLTLILTLKSDPYPNRNHNPNPTYPNKPIEPYQTVLILTDTVGRQSERCPAIGRLQYLLEQTATGFHSYCDMTGWSLSRGLAPPQHDIKFYAQLL